MSDGFLQDMHIWLTKAPVQNPLLCEEDAAAQAMVSTGSSSEST